MAQVAKKMSKTTIVIGSVIGLGLLVATVLYFKKSSKATTKTGDKSKGDDVNKGSDHIDAKTKSASDKAAKDHSDSVAKAVAQSDPSTQTPSGTVVAATADGSPVVAPADGQTGAAEGSQILYIAPRNGNGKVTDTNTIEVRTGDALFADGALVQLTTPQYNGQYTVSGSWDAGDGTGSVFLSVPYVDLGTKNSAGVPTDTSPGTIAVVGDPSATAPPASTPIDPNAPAGQIPATLPAPADDSQPGLGVSAPNDSAPSSFDGMPNENFDMEFSHAFGDFFKKTFKKIGTWEKKVLAKIAAKFKKAHKPGAAPAKFIRLIPKAEAIKRIALKDRGKASGLKGSQLKAYIMANKHK